RWHEFLKSAAPYLPARSSWLRSFDVAESAHRLTALSRYRPLASKQRRIDPQAPTLWCSNLACARGQHISQASLSPCALKILAQHNAMFEHYAVGQRA